MNPRYRSAVTGEYVSQSFAELHPRQTVKEEDEKLPPNDEPKTREEEAEKE